MLDDPLLEILTPDEYLEMQADVVLAESEEFPADDYRYSPSLYIEDYFGWLPWGGVDGAGQQEVIDAYTLAIRQQHERHAYNNDEVKEEDLRYWGVGDPIQSIISVDAGHSVGKTKVLSGLVNHFFDCFSPSIIYSFAPTKEQIHDLLWKEIKVDRRNAIDLPGRILDLRLEISDDHFAKGQATNNSQGAGTERAQGQHGDYLMFVIDEAEGVADFVYEAIDSMTSGGIAHIVLIARNPRTASCKAHKIRQNKNVKAMRISCLNHPNVVTGREVIPASVSRRWVDEKIDEWCRIVEKHNEDNFTFEVPWRDGIFEPYNDFFLWRVLGIVGGQNADDVLIPLGRFEAAVKREKPVGDLATDKTHAQLGIDCARFGNDIGTGYSNHSGYARRYAEFPQKRTRDYHMATKAELVRLSDLGVTHVCINVDAGGGYGAGVIDALLADHELINMFEEFVVNEIHFNATPLDESAYADRITELTAESAEKMKEMVILEPPKELISDLTDRKYEWVLKGRKWVKALESKKKFKKRIVRSPDDGDGYVLATAGADWGSWVYG